MKSPNYEIFTSIVLDSMNGIYKIDDKNISNACDIKLHCDCGRWHVEVIRTDNKEHVEHYVSNALAYQLEKQNKKSPENLVDLWKSNPEKKN